MAPQRKVLELSNAGVMLAVPGDRIPAGTYRKLLNMTAFRDGYIENRRGSSLLDATDLGSAVHSQARMLSQSNIYNYQGASTSLFRDFSSIQTGYSGNGLVMSDYKINDARLPHMIVFDSSRRDKDNGTTVQNFGIAGPLIAAVFDTGTDIDKTIDLFEYANDAAIQAAYTLSSMTAATDSTDPQQGSFSGAFTVAAGTTGNATLTSSLDLENFASVASDQSDRIHFWLKIDKPQNVVDIKIMFDVDPSTNDFTKNYYVKAIGPQSPTLSADEEYDGSLDTGATDQELREFMVNRLSDWVESVFNQYQGTTIPTPSGSTLPRVVVDLGIWTPKKIRSMDRQKLIDAYVLVFGEDQLPAALRDRPLDIDLGQSVWKEFFVSKAEFDRVGTHANDWGNVAAFRIEVQTNSGSAVTMNIDDVRLTSVRLQGTYQWAYRYRNNVTNIVSPFSPLIEDNSTTIGATGSADITVVNPTDQQVTHIDLYRQGGLVPGTFGFVKSVEVSAYTGTATITDDVRDTELTDAVADFGDAIEITNLLNAAAAVLKTVRKTTDNGSNYTDYTSNSRDADAGTHVEIGALDTVANGDWLVVGADTFFRKILIDMDATNVNANAATLTAEIWDGSAWVAVRNLTDGTATGGATFAQDGTIEFDMPEEFEWKTNEIDSVTAYHVRLSVSAALSATTNIDEVRASPSEIDASAFAIHDDRVWVADDRNPDRLWYSRRFRVEEFTIGGYITVTQDSGPLVRPFALDDQLWAFTAKTVLRVLGNQEANFRTIPTSVENGLFAKYAICRGKNVIFYRAPKGIYALYSSGESTKISEPIDVIFKGIAGGSVAHLQAIDPDFASTERMEYFDEKVHYSYQATNGNRYEVIYDTIMKRWEWTDLPATSYMRADDVGKLYSGHDDNFVYERDTGQQDQGVDISMDFATAYDDFGAPDTDKLIPEVIIDCDLNGEAVDFQLDFDNGDASETLSGATNSGRGLIHFPVSDDRQARNISFRVTDANGGSRIRFYKVHFHVEVLTPERRHIDTGEMDFGFTRWKYLRRLWVSGKTADDVTIDIYADETLVHTTKFQIPATTGWESIPIILPAGLKGRLFRFDFSSDSAFTVFLDQSDIEWHPLFGQRGYQRSPLARVS